MENQGWHELKRSNRPTLSYRDEGKGRPVVFVHGVGGDSGNWDDVLGALSPGLRCIRMDLSGHGRSGRISGTLTLADLARDVTDVMDALGVRSSCLVGFSLGGLIAQWIALESPERVEKLALISAVAGRTEADRARVAERLTVLRAEGIAAISGNSRERWFTEEFRRAHPEKVEARIRQLLANDPVSYLQAYTVFSTSDLAERLSAISAPTLIATGEHDAGSSPRMAQLMHGKIGGSTLRILPGLRHSVLIEAPGAVAGLLNEFL